MTYTTVTECRACGGALIERLHLGTQAMTGIFPEPGTGVDSGPLRLVQCQAPECGLVQLGETYDLGAMYGDNYGYRSGLNPSMIRHLGGVVDYAQRFVTLEKNDVVVDIGSNDGTLLGFYGHLPVHRVGFDPTIKKFGHHYKPGIIKVPDFFSAPAYPLDEDAKVITSIACFYDLPDPQQFAYQVGAILHIDGVWVFEQSYLVSMLRANAFDSICHEHLEYYHLKPIKRILDRAGLVIVDLELNDTNGGSIRIAAKHQVSGTESPRVAAFLAMEEGYLFGEEPWFCFRARIQDAVFRLKTYLFAAKEEGRLVLGLGASTKGNVLLQYAGIGPDSLPAIAEVNPDKYGRVTPGTNIPIISEEAAAAMKPDAYLVLPWHFKEGFLKRMGVDRPDLVFPLPKLEVL